ncbi:MULTISPECIES: flagellar basal body L-ring protein FlgH [unclassified Burkholderia]|uniref:flagellar basal body L-ring protein FlgH n=1 Tax=unclassified Burkholderia TaxID=2613784 RepID=UPI0007537CCC|nr:MULTISPECIES: flagellar basal body L-ring protein FlgH [unclassified Burkholderia]KUY72495.1 flagellar basal body L-ring protein [Burkholderia sp. RF4-BP95]KUY99843.1 flagellar basal body L-ring protein [Burkholderia sp. RF7-non_BP1]KUZ03978.1 flagellar basal body L-ring protein [Burkholderia sp. RF7-non_BP4]
MKQRLLLLPPVALLGACALLDPPRPDFAEDDLPPATWALTAPRAGGVFNAATAWSLAADGRAYRPGDTLTVTLDETTQASKRADTRFGKSNDVSVEPGRLFGSPIDLDTSIGANRKFDGSGSSSQQNSLRGEITVIVTDVLAGGLLQVRGEKVLSLNQGEEVMRLTGYVRQADIDTNNRVSSRRIANARIQYVGKGALSESNSAGWLTRFLNSPWMPF